MNYKNFFKSTGLTNDGLIGTGTFGRSFLAQSRWIPHISDISPRVAELCCKYSTFPVKVDLGPGELMQRCEALDINRARKELGFEPQFSVEEGIRKNAGWLENKLK